MMIVTCKNQKCRYQWIPRVPKPKKCPECLRRIKYSKPVKSLVGILIASLICSNAYAKAVTLQGGYLHTPNSNYGDSAGFNARLEAPVYGDFSLAGEFGYHGPQSHTPYGDISGYSSLGEVIYYAPLNWAIKPYLLGGLGWSWWNFDRSEDLQNKKIEVNLGNSFAKKVGIGFDYPIGNDWSINVEWNYFQSHVPKKSFYESDGSFANVVTDEKTIGQEETNIIIGIKRKF